MENLKHEDLLIKLRAKLNEEKIKLWEAPYVVDGTPAVKDLYELATKYAEALSTDMSMTMVGLYELQLHSMERSKSNVEFKETGCATLRVKATMPREKPKVLNVVKPLNITGEELASTVGEMLNVPANRVKLIYNGKIINQREFLQKQGVKHGVQIMALVMEESPEALQKEDNMYMEMKSTMDDATLLSDYMEDFGEDEEYIKLEDQSGKAVDVPAAERKALLVGLALHERGRAAACKRDYSLALVLLLEADRQMSECSSSILSSVDNCAILQLDIAWCYLCLQNLSSANDAAARLAKAEEAFRASYGEDHQRLIALKGTNANERVLFMRLYLLQGIVAYHQNKRAEARALLEKAEAELNCLRVDESSVVALTELGWSAGQARTGLRAAKGDRDRAHHYLEGRRQERLKAREAHRAEREELALRALLGSAADVEGLRELRSLQKLLEAGFPRRRAIWALRRTEFNMQEATDLLENPHPEDENCEEESELPKTAGQEPDNKMLAELVLHVCQLEGMGYGAEEARKALLSSGNRMDVALEILTQRQDDPDMASPSTSAGMTKRQKLEEEQRRAKERQMALNRLKSCIRTEEDDYLSASLDEEEQFLAQYKSLL